MEIGERIRRARVERRLTLRHAAEMATITPTMLSAIERGKQEPTEEHIALIAGALGISEDFDVADDIPAPRIHTAMAAILADVPAIGKDQRNAQQGFSFRGIDQAYNSLHGLFAKHGVYVLPEVLDRQREERTTTRGGVLAFTTMRVRYTFTATDGSSVSCVVDGEGMDSGDKSTPKALAIAAKYALLQVFLVPTRDMPDPDAESHEVAYERITEAQAADLAALIEDVGADRARFLKWLKVEALADVPASSYSAAVTALEKKRKAA